MTADDRRESARPHGGGSEERGDEAVAGRQGQQNTSDQAATQHSSSSGPEASGTQGQSLGTIERRARRPGEWGKKSPTDSSGTR
jgi:hypothetical protein